MSWRRVLNIRRYEITNIGCNNEERIGVLTRAFVSKECNSYMIVDISASNAVPFCTHVFYDKKENFLKDLDVKTKYFVDNILGKIEIDLLVNRKDNLQLKFVKKTKPENIAYNEYYIEIQDNYNLKSYELLRKIMYVLSRLENINNDENMALKINEKLFVMKTGKNKYVFSKTPKMYI